MSSKTIKDIIPGINSNQLKLLHRALLEYVIQDDQEVSDDIWAEPRPEKVRAQNEIKVTQRVALQAFLGLKE